MTPTVFDERRCKLGEGPLWHPGRQQFFWFDILSKKLLSKKADGPLEWSFDECVSAAGWVDNDTLLIASETSLSRFDLNTGASQKLVDLEADIATRRSNDGRADPWGGFWIGTMAKDPATGEKGAIYRFYKGELRELVSEVAIPNAICFSPDRRFAYFADTAKRLVLRQALNPEDGWPDGSRAETFLDLNISELNPDGAVIDAEGHMWLSMWGAARVNRYNLDGEEVLHLDLPASQVTCPAFGGEDYRSIFITSAAIGIANADKTAGQTFQVETNITGLPEYQVIC